MTYPNDYTRTRKDVEKGSEAVPELLRVQANSLIWQNDTSRLRQGKIFCQGEQRASQWVTSDDDRGEQRRDHTDR